MLDVDISLPISKCSCGVSFFFKKMRTLSSPFCGPLFYTSGDVSLGSKREWLPSACMLPCLRTTDPSGSPQVRHLSTTWLPDGSQSLRKRSLGQTPVCQSFCSQRKEVGVSFPTCITGHMISRGSTSGRGVCIQGGCIQGGLHLGGGGWVDPPPPTSTTGYFQ